MIKEYYENICQGKEVRANLIALKKEIKEESGKRAFAYLLAGDYGRIGELLKHEDPKVRKNAALILGEMECEDMLPYLYAAYEKEEQLFVRPSYLKAMSWYDCRPYVTKLQNRKEQLLAHPGSEADQKHEREELAALRTFLSGYVKEKGHTFTELARETDVILLTNREHREITKDQIQEEKCVLLAGGVRVKTRDLSQFWKIRTWSEMLFPVPGCGSLPEDPKEAGKQLAKTALLPFLKSCHKGEGTFYFRVELRGKMDLDQKAAFTKKFAKTLEQASGRELLNSTSVYEVEIRLLQKKDGTFVPLLKLFTLKDKRFAYRKQTLAASIQPVNAALMMQLLKPWLKEGAQVIDPFCGVGTMLIERAKVMEAKPLYGIDIYGEAIEKARINTEEAGLTINYINRDFLDFKHSYLFDELITNMPTVTKAKSVEEITQLYERSLEQTRWVVKKDGILALYTTEETILRHCLKNCDFLEPEKKWVIREKEGSVLYLLRMR